MTFPRLPLGSPYDWMLTTAALGMLTGILGAFVWRYQERPSRRVREWDPFSGKPQPPGMEPNWLSHWLFVFTARRSDLPDWRAWASAWLFRVSLVVMIALVIADGFA